MSSTDKKIFDITETSKQSGVTITSDKLSLPSDSVDHVLVATVPSSANLNSTVNVEVEMSPDGENWCPALNPVTTNIPGSITPAILGNTQYVDLTTTAPIYNGYAKGTLNFDPSLTDPTGFEEVLEGQGQYDFMHQHIAVNKCFNHSMWLKSNVLPNSSYTPVLFRHGGHDTFENTQVVELTDTVTQNLCAYRLLNTRYITLPPVSTTTDNSLNTSSSTIKSPFYVNGDSSQAFPPMDYDVSTAPEKGITIGFWHRGGAVSDWKFKRLFEMELSNGNYLVIDRSSNGRIDVVLVNSSGTALSGRLGDNLTTVVEDGNWHYIAIRINSSTGGTGIQVSVDGGSFASSGAGYSNTDLLDSNNTGVTIDNFIINKRASSSFSDFNINIDIDNVCFIKGYLDNTQVASLYANANDPYKASLGSNAVVTSFLQFGDNPNDNTSTPIIYSGNGMSLTAGNVSPTFNTYTTGETPEEIFVDSFPSVFTSTADFSISGWFKTPLNATGTLFSNTGGAAATGLKVDVLGSTITASYVSSASSFSTSVSHSTLGTFNDGEWHHITMVMSSGSQLIVVDNIHSQASNNALTDDHLRGSNGFTLLGDGQNNAGASNPSSTDSSKLHATLSNWSIHSEALDEYGIAQLYSNGHVRNAMNLPSIDSTKVEGFWQLNDSTTPEQDLSGNGYDLTLQAPDIWGNEQYIEGISAPFTSIGEGVYKEVNNGGFFSSGQSSSESGGSRNYFYGYNNTLNFWLHVPSNYTADTESIPLLVDYNDTTGTTDYFLYVQYYPSINTLRYGGKNAGVQTGINVKLDNTDGEGDVTGQWCMVTILLGTDPGAATCYINGNLRTSTSFGTSTSRPPSSIAINASLILGNGRRAQNSTAFPAYTGISGASVKIDNIDCFVDTLTSTEISSLYNSGTPKNASTVNSTVYQSLKFETNDGDSETTINCQVSNVQYDKNTNITATYLTSYLNTDPMYTQGGTSVLTDFLVPATGATLVEKHINGNAITLSITKSFDFTSKSWVTDNSGEEAFCLSFNGFQDQAEYFAMFKISQVDLPDGLISILDGNWHNVSIHYRGINDFGSDAPTVDGNGQIIAEGSEVVEGFSVVRFGNGASASENYNFTINLDGYALSLHLGAVGADYIGGLGSQLVSESIGGVNTNVGFVIYNRHLRHDENNNQEVSKPHGQFGAGVNAYLSTDQDPNAFRGSVDETSFHTDCWWKNQSGTGIIPNLFNREMTYTLYGRSNALNNRGEGLTYPKGVPYPLLNPEVIVLSQDINDIVGTNQFINPIRKGDTQPWDSQVSIGGLEGWWRWGDTIGDCSDTIKDVKSEIDGVNTRHITTVHLTDQGGNSNKIAADGETIYLADQDEVTTEGVFGVDYGQIILEDLVALVGTAACAVKDIPTQLLQYVRIKLTGAGTCDIGKDKLKLEMHFRKRRMR